MRTVGQMTPTLAVRVALPKARFGGAHWATEAEIEALIWLVSCDGVVTTDRIGADLARDEDCKTPGADRQRGHALMRELLHVKAVRRTREGYYATERGRIAAALAMAKRPGTIECFFDDE